MSKLIDFGMTDYRRTVSVLEKQKSGDLGDGSQEERWTDGGEFRRWLEELKLGEENTEALLKIVPSVSLPGNHGPLFGVERFINENSESDHKVRESGFLIFATGPNGDFIVVDIKDGSGETGWLPMAMIWGMEIGEVRDHFIPTNPTLGDFLRASEEEWSKVPKDWYDARDQAAKNNLEN